MNRRLASVQIVSLTSVAWYALDWLNNALLGFLKVSPYIFTVYPLSGLRLVVVILFNEVGAIGLCIGYVLSAVGLRGFSYQDALALGVLSSLAPVLAYKLWQKLTHISSAFENVNFHKLFLLVFLHSTLTAVFRTTYLLLFAKASDWQDVLVMFASNFCGALIFLYAIKYSAHFYRSKRKR
jgi:hypothetical protein